MNKFKALSFKQKIIYTIILLLIFSILTHIPTLFINREYIQELVKIDSLSFLNLLSGGSFERMSIMALSVTPYITASIIIQLLSLIFPRLDEIKKDGKVGLLRIEKYTIILGIILSFIEAISIMSTYGKQGLLSNYTWYTVLISACIITFGTTLAILMGKFITDNLFGNGISLILLYGILSSFIPGFISIYTGNNILVRVISIIISLILIYCLFSITYYIINCEKRIPVIYSLQKFKNYIPLKLLANSVIPVIFASAIITLPSLIQSFTGGKSIIYDIFNSMNWFKLDKWYANLGIIIYIVLIILFNYFSNMMNVNTYDITNNLRQNGGTVPGIRPGKNTKDYFDKQLKYMTLLGGIILSLIALTPNIISAIINIGNIRFLGTSMILIVSIINETKESYNAEKIGTVYKPSIFALR